MMGGNVGIGDHIKVGSGARLAGKTGVMVDIDPGAVVSGQPSRDHKTHLREYLALTRLPDLLQKVKRLERDVARWKKAAGE